MVDGGHKNKKNRRSADRGALYSVTLVTSITSEPKTSYRTSFLMTHARVEVKIDVSCARKPKIIARFGFRLAVDFFFARDRLVFVVHYF